MAISDLEFIKGRVKLKFRDTHYTVVKGNEEREFSVEEYYDLYLQNWENAIDDAKEHSLKLQICNNAILEHRKEEYDTAHSEIRKYIQKNLTQLLAIKAYLIGMQNAYQQSIDPSTPLSETEERIVQEFEYDKPKGWKHYFKNERDFVLFVGLLANHFEGKEVRKSMPHIQINEGTKTPILNLLGILHAQLNRTNVKLSRDSDYHSIAKCLNLLSKMSEGDIYRGFTRRR